MALRPKQQGPRINEQIRAKSVRVVDDSGVVGVMSVPEAIRIAKERGLDLIEVAQNEQGSVAKLQDYGKYKYDLKKKEKEIRQNQKIVEIKELNLRPRTDDHDLDTKVRHAVRFLQDGNKVKFSMRFSGREMAHTSVGVEVLKKIEDSLKEHGERESLSRLEGKHIYMTVAPKKG